MFVAAQLPACISALVWTDVPAPGVDLYELGQGKITCCDIHLGVAVTTVEHHQSHLSECVCVCVSACVGVCECVCLCWMSPRKR